MITTVGTALMVGVGLFHGGTVAQRAGRVLTLVLCWLFLCLVGSVFGGFAQFAAESYVKDSDPYWQRSYESTEEYRERIDSLESP